MRAVYRNLGARSRQVVAGPGVGLDNAVISIGGGRVLLVTSDPVSVIPAIGLETSAWMSVHLIASDYATSGLLPQFASFVFNFPRALGADQREDYLRSIGAECKRLGIAIISGHTGTYPGSDFTVVGGGSMFGFGKEGSFVTSAMARDGDVIMMTKGSAIEAAASLAMSFPLRTEKIVGARKAERARKMIRQTSTVEDSMAVASVGIGRNHVTSMHDATEGGVYGGLLEMATASGKSFHVDSSKVLITAEARAVCEAFGIDPFTSLSEGTLLLTCRRSVAESVGRKLARKGTQAREIGFVRRGSGLWLSNGNGHESRFLPVRDGYWEAYSKATSAGFD